MTFKVTGARMILILSVLLWTGIALGASQWVALDNQREVAPTVQVLDHNAARTTLQVTLHGFWSENVNEAGETFQVLSFGDVATTQEVGFPMLPMIHKLVGIPARSDLRVRISEADLTTLANYRVYPFQTPTTDELVQPAFVLDQGAYAMNELYPREIAVVSAPQIWRDVRLTELHLSPVRYNPTSHEIVVARSFIVTIEYVGTNLYHALDRDPTSVQPPYYKMYQSALVNFNQMGLDDHGLDLPGTKYLFVMKQEAYTHVLPIINFRHAQGYKTEVKYIESPSFDDEYEIKNYVAQLYQAGGLEYIMMVGDAYYAGGPSAVDVPMHYWVDSYSDSWYTSMQGDGDYFADLAIGRIVYDNAVELDHQVDKIMDYLQTPNTTSNWAGNSLLVAHQEQYPQKYTQCKEEIRTFSYALQTPTFATAYGGAGATNNQVINYINTSGTGLLNYRGHGSDTEWWQWGPSGSFTATQVNQLTNVDKYFVHFDVCCDNMNIVSYNGNCLAESFMKATAAAVAINCAIIPSYTIPNHDYDKEFYKALFNNGIWNIGYASNYANVTVVTVHGSLGQSNYRTYLWLGDACTDLWTGIPQQLAMSYSSTINLATQDFTVTVTKNGQPVNGALVCGQSATAYARGFTNSSGIAYLVFSEYPSAQTTVTLTATAHNGLAATGSCTIIPATSPYNIVVDAVPTSSLTIPASGGSFTYTVDVWSYESFLINAVGWSDWIYPNATVHAPFFTRYLIMAPGFHVNRSLIQTVAGSEPAGNYTFRVNVGTYAGGTIYANDTFNFTKSGDDGALGEWVAQSASSGWEEDLAGSANLPQEYSLTQHPNPFNPETNISFALPVDAQVRLAIYDTMGREVAVLVEGYRSAGVHQVTFDASKLASGIYLSDLQANGLHLTGKMVLLK